ncbi:MAG: ketol-acid reductoisomerase [Candidatus Thorarchaeota archaeon]|jgi:ketol-acid reductoisomerase
MTGDDDSGSKKSSVPVYFDEDANLELIDGVVAIIGYGNQGRAQAINLRESGLEVVVGNIRDEYWEIAVSDGFEVHAIRDAIKRARFAIVLIPDEVQPSIFEADILPEMTSEKVLCFASGYNITFDQLALPENFDTILVAPRMIGAGVRDAYEKNRGFYVFVGVHNDISGKALQYALALSKGIGATKPGGALLEVSFRQETELDLFNEQCFGPAFGQVLTTAVDVAMEAGYPPEAVLIELYMSGELAYTMENIAKLGTLKQLELHSPTSQYGSMSRGIRYANPELREQMQKSLGEIQDGSFAEEFAKEYELDLEILDDMKEMAQNVPIVVLDKEVRERLRFIVPGYDEPFYEYKKREE